MRKCGFLDCNNSAERKGDECLSCSERKEGKICSVCQKEVDVREGVVFFPSITAWKNLHLGLQKLQDKVPVEFRDRIDQILSETKLSSAELELVNKFGETISGYLSEKGGKQYHIGWVKVCPDCSEGELRTRLNTLESSNPALATSLQNKVQLQPETKLILQEIEQEIGDDRLGEIYEGIEEEIYGKGKDPDPTIPTPTAPTAAEITASKNKANAAISSGDKAQLQAAKTELESLKSRLEAAGVSATEISTLIQSVNTKIQELEGDTAYRQRVISEITAKLTANGISETDLDDASKTKLAALKAGQTSGAEINQAADFIKQAADTAMVTKKVTEFTAQVNQLIQSKNKTEQQKLKTQLTTLLTNTLYKSQKTKLQSLITQLDNSLKDQGQPLTNHNPNSNFPWAYVLPIILLAIVLVAVVFMWSKKKKKNRNKYNQQIR